MALVITDSTHFVGEINLPNLDTGSPQLSYLQTMIDRHEPSYLSDVLGYELAQLLIEDQGVASPPTSGVYYDLLQGKEFTDSLGRLNKWEGFASPVYNPIAHYIYCLVLRDSHSTFNGIGVTRPKSENSEIYSPHEKITYAWNRMVDINCVLHDFLTQNIDDYPSYEGVRGPRDLSWGNRKYFTRENMLGI